MTENELISMGFSVGTFIAAALAFFSGREVERRLAVMIVLSYALSNVAVITLGYTLAPRVFVVIDVGCVGVCFLMAKRSPLVRFMLALFGLQLASHFVAFSDSLQASRNYYVINNVLYAAQLLLLGGAGLVGLARLRSIGDGVRGVPADHVRSVGR